MGEAWGRLRVEGAIYEGARATVYRARGDDGQRFVLKVLSTSFDDAVHRARLERELVMATRAEAESIVRAYGSTLYEGRLALVLEDMDGEALSKTLAANAPLDVTLPIAVAIARALGVVHEAGIVHRDVKPSNVIHNPRTGQVKLTDFGVARMSGELQSKTSTGFEGTLAYMAPEQSGRMGRGVDRRADLYSFGVLLYELFAKQRPFQATDTLQWMHAHAAQIPKPLTDIPHFPAVLSDVVAKLLAKAPEERYQSAEGVERDLSKCLAALRSTGTIPPFPIAAEDTSGEFRLTGTLHGRDQETNALSAAFTRVATTSRTEVMLIAGYAGIGKTSLVRHLEGPVARRQGYFASGKFDQFRRHLPYFAVAEACTSLVDQLLTTSGERLARWRTRLLDALDGNGQVLLDLFPALERIIGTQRILPELPPGAVQNRLHGAVRAFLRAFDQPLVVFLDDLQWADSASLELLEAVLAHGAQLPLLVVLAYRDHEVGAGHPFADVVGRLRGAGTPVATLTLGPLTTETVRALVHDTLRVKDASVDPLADLAMSKTAGNPFFVREFLRTLHLDGLLRFDRARRAWTFEESAVHARVITDNVVTLMLERLEQLPTDSREALRLAAFFGSEVAVDDVAEAMSVTVESVVKALGAASERGLLSISVSAEGRAAARFEHDRIQQAALALTAAERRAAEHLRVARQWWARLEHDPAAARLFEVANHLDAAFDLLLAESRPGEHERALALFESAARKAKAATAYVQACSYFTRAVQLLGAEAWTTHFEVAYDVVVAMSECEYLAGNLEGARAHFEELLGRARTDLERARVYYLEIRLFQVAGDMAEAVDISVRSFRLFGLDIPEPADVEKTVGALFEKVAERLGDRPIASHIDDPPMTDASIMMLADLLEASGPPIYMVKPELFGWVALQLTLHSLEYGNAEASCYGYGIYALLRAAVLGDVAGGYECSLLAIELNRKLAAVKLEGCMLHLLGDHVNFWKNPISTDRNILERGFAACVRGGDHIYSNYIGFQAPWHSIEAGTALSDVAVQVEKYAAFARETNYGAVHWTLCTERQFILALMGKTGAVGRLSSDGFDERAAIGAVTDARFGCGIVYFHIMQMILKFTFGDYAGAKDAADRATPELGSAFSMPIAVSYAVYRALTLAALPDAKSHIENIEKHHRELVGWARTCPANFADKAALIGAELARLRGDTGAALRLYEEARLAARSQSFLQYEALACELGAAMYGALGVDSVKRTLLSDAYALYRRWGAAGKAGVLLANHRGLDRSPVVPKVEASGSTGTTSGADATGTSSSDGTIDLVSVLKAAQSISAEIVLPRLLPKLIAIVVEYTGAQRGSLVLVDGDRLTLAAQAAFGDDKTGPTSIAPPQLANTLPSSVLQYVVRRTEVVVIDDASASNKFGADEYFQRSVHRSILCKPIMRQGRLLGMFYLENALAPAAFGPDRLTTLEILASQTAISIDNSRLYEESLAAVSARDEFLSIASHELRTPLTPLAMQVHRLTSAIRRDTLRDMPTDVLERLATTCESQIARMNRLVNALLDVSRIESGKMTLQRERIDLGDLVASVVDAHTAQARAAKCVVSLRIEDGLRVQGDRLRVEQVISNLLLNAIKFGRGEPVEMSLSKSGSDAVLVVEDHGVGVVGSDRIRIFERFERVQSKTNVDGLGLGLFIVRAIVDAHGGRIEVGGAAGEGAVFRVTLPLSP